MAPNKLDVYFVADMVVVDIDFLCGRYGFLLWLTSSWCGRYGLWPIWSHPVNNLSVIYKSVWLADFAVKVWWLNWLLGVDCCVRIHSLLFCEPACCIYVSWSHLLGELLAPLLLAASGAYTPRLGEKGTKSTLDITLTNSNILYFLQEIARRLWNH